MRRQTNQVHSTRPRPEDITKGQHPPTESRSVLQTRNNQKTKNAETNTRTTPNQQTGEDHHAQARGEPKPDPKPKNAKKHHKHETQTRTQKRAARDTRAKQPQTGLRAKTHPHPKPQKTRNLGNTPTSATHPPAQPQWVIQSVTHQSDVSVWERDRQSQKPTNRKGSTDGKTIIRHPLTPSYIL
jgi:hypothetical protein